MKRTEWKMLKAAALWEHIAASRPQSIASSPFSPTEETGSGPGDVVDRRSVFTQRSADRYDQYLETGFGRNVSVKDG